MLTLILLFTILAAFVCMTKGKLQQEVAMPLAALVGLALVGVQDAKAGSAEVDLVLREAFSEFSRIAVIFTAVAVPAHILQRAGALNWLAMLIGEWLGLVIRRLKVGPFTVVPAACLLASYCMAALFHNTTSILVCACVIVLICQSYGLRPLPVLLGSLVASNLGGFSTRWGDTPNITQAHIWQLHHSDFIWEILPINIGLMLILSATVSLLIWRRKQHTPTKSDNFDVVHALVAFRSARRTNPIDRRLLCIGLLGLAIAIIGPMIYPSKELAICALGISLCVLLERSDHRRETLLALRIETYATLCAIFILAQVLAHSQIGVGEHLKSGLAMSGMSVWSIATASYLGTLFTEAASWATAVSPIVYASAPTHDAAWALGAGICAGSSSLVTAATAGIILTRETEQNGEDARVTFGAYLGFGLCFSLVMLAYYIIVLSIVWGR